MRNFILLAAILSAPTWAHAQRNLKDIPDPDPEVERKSFLVAPGFEVSLYAADPLLAKPIQMNFDAKGRLWVASSEVYPQIKPGQPATDKILVLEDKDGDGRADSTTVFADGLLIPTGVEPGDGGAYVANSTELIHLKDADGDGKADTRRVMLSGFGTEDTHHIIHTFRWGEDGLLYFNQSIYIHSHIETPHGPRRLNGGGIWQFRPETMGLEVFARGWVNAWGHHQDAWGASFATDGAGGEGINFIVPGAYYTTAPDAVRILPGLNPGSPKYCGLEVVSGRHLPDDWQGNLITNDFRANRVCRFILSDDGSGFSAREQQELIKTSHGAFRPIDVKMGPDGAIYIADWYNPIIQHGEVDFRDPRRDHVHGRIWRVTAKGRPLVERPRLDGASVDSLLESLKAPEGYTRHFARRVLKERGAKDVVPALAAWARGLDPKDANFEHHRLEALWTYQALDVPEPQLLTSVLNSPDPRARAAASRIVPHWQGRTSAEPRAVLTPRAVDGHPRVRLEAIRALAKVDDPRALEAAIRAMDQPMDRWIEYALWLTCRETQSRWLPALQAGTLDLGGDARKLAFALNAAGSPAVVGPLVESLKAGRVGAAQEPSAVQLIAALGNARELGSLLDLALAETESDGRRAAILDAIASAARSRKVRPEGDLTRLGLLLESKDREVLRATIGAIGAWKLDSLTTRALASLKDGDDGPLFEAYVGALAEIGGSENRRSLLSVARDGSPTRAARSVVALAAIDPEGAVGRALAVLPVLAESAKPSDREAGMAMVAGILNRKRSSEALRREVEALAEGKLPVDAAKLAIRTARASGRDESALIAALAKAGKVASGPVALSEAEMKSAVADVLAQGDPARGEQVFRRKEMQCLNCHAIAGAGGQVGPGLESIGASAPIDYLIDSLLQPSKQIKEGYHTLTIATDDGRVVTGIKLRDDDKEVALRDAEGRETSVPAKSVEEKKEAGSLMPAGLTETLTRGEFLDLVRFLSELGKVGPYSVGKERVVRRWEVMATEPDAPRKVLGFGTEIAQAFAKGGAAWVPAYSTVAGVLPRGDIPPQEGLGDKDDAPRLARFRIEVTTGGEVGIRHNAMPPGRVLVELFVDDRRVNASPEITPTLAPGVHTVTFYLMSGKGEPLRAELFDVPGSPARAQTVVGK